MKAYQECLSATGTNHAPWYVAPADDKENARLIVSRIVLDTLEGLRMAYPKMTAKRRRELLSIRKELGSLSKGPRLKSNGTSRDRKGPVKLHQKTKMPITPHALRIISQATIITDLPQPVIRLSRVHTGNLYKVAQSEFSMAGVHCCGPFKNLRTGNWGIPGTASLLSTVS
jgi:hypothetical protein